jgi:putative FmdB family regulatory protein
MPIYEYRCSQCEERFETLVARSDPAAPRCPRCGAGEIERLPSTFAVTGPQGDAAPGPCNFPKCARCVQ